MKTILITGGAGYVGTLLSQQLAKKYKIIVYDTFWFGDFIVSNKNIKKIKADIRDISALNEINDKIDIVIHLACISNDVSFELNEKLSEEINFKAFEPLLRFFKNKGVKQFINASSSSVYGFSDSPNVTEDYPLIPLTLYNKFKGFCEPILFDYHDNNFICTNVRPATLCGYSPRLRLDLSVNILTHHAIKNNLIKVFGGSQMRPNLHVKDMCNFYEFLINQNEKIIANQTYNISEENISIEKIAIKIQKILKEKKNIDIKIEKISSTDDKRSYYLNSDKAKKKLNFKLEYSIDDAIIELAEILKTPHFDDSFDNTIYYNVKRLKELKIS
jgi:nucleoside-diphosphate-sugar epimerase